MRVRAGRDVVFDELENQFLEELYESVILNNCVNNCFFFYLHGLYGNGCLECTALI